MTSAPPVNFADRLIRRLRAVGNPLCVGLDPHLAMIPDLFRRGDMSPRAPETVDAVGEFLRSVLARVGGRAAAVKPQSAFFERLGWRGVRLLETLVGECRAQGYLVILDAKRGDIGSTAEGYAGAYLAPDSPISADALTVNPYLGTDTLEPFVAACQAGGRGLFTLVKTSNPGSGDFQDVLVDGLPLYRKVASKIRRFEDALLGETGWSSNGIVAGATYPEDAVQIREDLPHSLFLIPGYGSQGGSARDAVRSFVPGPAGLEGGLVNSSRAILFPKHGGTSASWDAAVDTALDKAVTELGDAVR
ncbi:MAG: orotidine-5'-phosphate decarboxylase [Capsulimonadaceae bacterium]